MTVRTLRVTFDVATKSLTIDAEDYATRAWLLALDAASADALLTLGRRVATRHDPLRVDRPPAALAAEFSSKVSEMFPDERIVVEAKLRRWAD